MNANHPRFDVAAVRAFEGAELVVRFVRPLDADQARNLFTPRAPRRGLVGFRLVFCQLKRPTSHTSPPTVLSGLRA